MHVSPPAGAADGASQVAAPAAFAATYAFPLDDFQTAGVAALAAGRSVLVAAPTGAGKTIVGEFAVWHAVARGGKCFYTTPIKALSNQKYADLAARHGAEHVGLLTGDNAINGDAPIVVMTTEVLRNMLYEGSRALLGLHAVVLDEVHYLADRERGAVWEEVIVQLPAGVQLACLSATVSNAEEFGAWLARTRAGCDVIISERRPVPLDHHYAVNERLYPVFRTGGTQAQQDKALVPNPEVLMLERRSGPGYQVSKRGRGQSSGARLRPPRRSDLVRDLGRRRWLPAIYFLFSRDGCDAAVTQLVTDGVRLTSAVEQQAIRALVDERTAHLDAADLAVLGFGQWAGALELGISAHHAGLVPAFKQTVEELFVRGLVKICFATETLALGINMPARTVVIERLEKWNGQRHELLTPGQFTQLTGRAGRRGLDDAGHAVVAYQRDLDFNTVASLVSRRTEPLRSSFAPSYNMAVNLLRRLSRPDAEALLAQSFAQYQADATVAGDEERSARNRAALAGYAENLRSGRGDFAAYWELKRELSRLESAGARQRRHGRADAVSAALAGLREGDVVALPSGGRRERYGAVVSRTESSAGAPLAGVVTDDRKLVRIGPREFDAPPVAVGRIQLPRDGGPRQPGYRKTVAEALRRASFAGPRPQEPSADVAAEAAAAARVAELRMALRAHPVHGDPELSEIEVWARRHDGLLADTERVERSVRHRTGSLVRQLDRIIDLLGDLGYLAGDGPSPTADGLRLARIYAETDLVLAECLRRGVLDGLDPPGLAAAASAFVFTPRSSDPPEPVLPTRAVAEAIGAAEEVWAEIVARERTARIPTTRPVDAGVAAVIHHWAQGAELDDALAEAAPEGLTPGDFVRNCKQVADLLRQVRDATTGTELSDTAHVAAKALVRGVVATTAL